MNFIFFGPQGSGKSTQAKLLGEKLNIPVIAPGDLTREIIEKREEPDWEKIEKLYEAGKLTPTEIIMRKVREKLSDAHCRTGFILDGFPRGPDQLKGLNTILGKNDFKIDKVFFIKISEGETIKRMLARGRSDDTPKGIRKRLQIFRELTGKVILYYRRLGLVEEINGEKPLEEVKKEIWQKMGIK